MQKAMIKAILLVGAATHAAEIPTLLVGIEINESYLTIDHAGRLLDILVYTDSGPMPAYNFLGKQLTAHQLHTELVWWLRRGKE